MVTIMYHLGGGVKWLLIYIHSLISVYTNLMAQLSCIQRHEIYIVLYALLDSGDPLLYSSRLCSLYTDMPP